MEDAVVAERLDRRSFCFAAFGGHDGDLCSRCYTRELPRRLRSALGGPRPALLGGGGAAAEGGIDACDVPLTDLLLEMDRDLRSHGHAWGCGAGAARHA